MLFMGLRVTAVPFLFRLPRKPQRGRGLGRDCGTYLRTMPSIILLQATMLVAGNLEGGRPLHGRRP